MYAQNLGVLVVSILAVAIVVVTLILLDLIVETVAVIVFGFVYCAHVPPTP
jgi:hypothetical protein